MKGKMERSAVSLSKKRVSFRSEKMLYLIEDIKCGETSNKPLYCLCGFYSQFQFYIS